ncbi:MAG: cupin domain-containing protein [Pseudanabaenaceae cyanobacterium bins.68]|nr:cupin domain-containing protein [Pseudanabaenaceae cyanobacterium bins.68]
MNPSEVIVNPVTGDRMTVLESRPNYTKIHFDLPPGAKGSPLHFHPTMAETFTVLEGCLDMEVNRQGNQRFLQAGETVHILPGTPHSFCNNSTEWVSFTTENKPGIGFERFIRGLYGLAIDGQVNSEGMPTNLLQLAVLLKQSDTVPVGIPPFLFHSLIAFLVGIAGFFHVDRSLSKYWH